MAEYPDFDRLRCWAEIDCDALRHNAAVAGSIAGGGPGCVMAVVKADAYGHSLPIVTEALRETIGAFAVANLSEALQVQRHAVRPGDGGQAPVYILSPALPSEMPDIIHGGFIPALSTLTEVRAAAAAAAAKGAAAPVHVVVDTGMGRMGTLPDAAPDIIAAVLAAGLSLDSVSSHFPSADEDETFTREQEAGFRSLVQSWQARFGPFRTHIANSAGILHYPRPAGETVRAGLMLYGLAPLPEHQARLRPVLTWKARVTLVRDLPAGWGISYGRSFITPAPMKVASLAAGYGDGYPRQVSGHGGAVIIRGRRCRILGRVTMDQILIDTAPLDPAPLPGEEAVLMGADGSSAIDARELAGLAGTIPWHVFTGITDRTVRIARNA